MEITRGDLIIVALADDYGKPRPAVVVQSDAFHAIPSVTVPPLSGDLQEAQQVCITVEPCTGTGLTRRSQVMIDEAATVPRTKIGQHISRVETGTIRAVFTALAGFLGLG